MKYRALEDLINILVKKAGYNLNEGITLEDIDILTKRKGEIDSRKEELNKSINNDSYIDKEEKGKDLEEKKFLEDTIDILKNQQETGELTTSELESLEEQVKFAQLKIDSKEYFDKTAKDLDDIRLESYSSEIAKATDIIEEKRKTPSELGLELLEAFREGKGFDEVEKTFNLLVKKANEANDKTVTEINDSNIFELIENYNQNKNTTYKKIQRNEYASKGDRESLNEMGKYHNSRISSYKETMDAIENRKRELSMLVDESKELYTKTLNERINKEKELEKYTKELYNSVNLAIYENDFNKYLDNIREEILDDKYLEDKYNKDVLSYKDEIRNLEINNKNLNALLLNEEKCLSIINKKMSKLNENNSDLIDDKIDYLYMNNRIENLTNEQQYYYVNIDVIKNEILNLWKKGGHAKELEEVKLPSAVNDEVEVEENENFSNSMYEDNLANDSIENTLEEPTPEIESLD